jgi:hypothetical protein
MKEASHTYIKKIHDDQDGQTSQALNPLNYLD